MDKITFAVPLIDLGSINNIEKITPIFGKPEWFMGMMNVRDEKVQIVDFAKWAMPQIAVDPDSFQYVIELGNSKWGITCTVACWNCEGKNVCFDPCNRIGKTV